MALLGALSLVSCGGVTSSGSNPGGGGGNGQPQLSASASSVSFGNVVVGTTNTQPVVLTNSGNANLNISQATISGLGFSMTGITAPLTLAAGKSSTVTVAFAPQGTVASSGSIVITSNATNSPTTISLSGTGVQTGTTHSVTLTWDPSSSTVTGYNVYRGTTSGGPYAKLNSSVIVVTTYSDSTVRAAQTYFYVTTAVNSSNVESVNSNEASGTVPSP